MGLPVTVEIGDASEDEPSEQLHNSPEQAVATRRSRAMTPPPRVMQARPAGRRPKIDGTSVLSREARAHLGSVGGSAAAGGAVPSEGARRGQQRRKPVTWCNWLWKSGGKALKRMRALLLWGCVAYVVAAGPLREMLAPIQRLLASTASVGESAAGALSSILDGGTQLVTASTSAVRAASFNTLGVAHAAWIGVDLVDMNATKIVGRVMGDDASAIEQWLFSENGREVLKGPAEEALLFWQGLLHSQTFRLPVVAAETEALVASGDYWVASGVVSYASSGLVVFEFRLLRMVFSPRWANPVWQLAGWNAADEYEQVLRIARDFAITVPAFNSTWDHVLPPPALRYVLVRSAQFASPSLLRFASAAPLLVALFRVHLGVWGHASAGIGCNGFGVCRSGAQLVELCALCGPASRETQRLGSLYRACGAPARLGSGTLWPSYAGKPRLSIQRRYGFSFGSSVQPIVPSKLRGALGLRWRTATAISSK